MGEREIKRGGFFSSGTSNIIDVNADVDVDVDDDV